MITEPDIDNLIKSKGAVYAAMQSLVKYIGTSMDQLDTLYVAGGFGNYLNISKAISIGLLPDIPEKKIVHWEQLPEGCSNGPPLGSGL